ncbi:MAG TPA: dihydroorotate dehydrogenase electron transfer subunit [Steroidobacteraceae bacterium]|nr:dihydroorotate dehydrogenase electron transfer subunit [Steroidobacteraceae bacterium]
MTTARDHSHRGKIVVEDAEVLGQQAWPGEQFVLHLRAPTIALRAEPGSFVHLTCDPDLPMRRPLSIQRADASSGTIEILYKIVGPGLRALSGARPGMRLSCLGPIGRGFVPHPERPRALLVGGGVGMPPIVFLAERLAAAGATGFRPLVLLGSEVPFPFRPRPSTLLVPGIPAGTIASLPLLEEWGVPSRLATLAGFAGCYPGLVTELAAAWLGTLASDRLAQVEMYACGPTPMLIAAARLAQRFAVPCQVALEEFMACAVGGCAGCAVRVETADGPAMKRVCVDGPVFDAYTVFPPAA